MQWCPYLISLLQDLFICLFVMLLVHVERLNQILKHHIRLDLKLIGKPCNLLNEFVNWCTHGVDYVFVDWCWLLWIHYWLSLLFFWWLFWLFLLSLILLDGVLYMDAKVFQAKSDSMEEVFNILQLIGFFLSVILKYLKTVPKFSSIAWLWYPTWFKTAWIMLWHRWRIFAWCSISAHLSI